MKNYFIIIENKLRNFLIRREANRIIKQISDRTFKIFGMDIKTSDQVKADDFKLFQNAPEGSLIDALPKVLLMAKNKNIKFKPYGKSIIQSHTEKLIGARASKTQLIIKELVRLGLDPTKCFFDQHQNLLIPVTQIDKIK